MNNDIIDSARDFLNILRSEKEVTVRFIKEDGTLRIMKCTLNFDEIPKKDHPKKIDLPQILKLIQKNQVVRVYDLVKRGWRSVPFNKVEWLDTTTKRFKIKLK